MNTKQKIRDVQHYQLDGMEVITALLAIATVLIVSYSVNTALLSM